MNKNSKNKRNSVTNNSANSNNDKLGIDFGFTNIGLKYSNSNNAKEQLNISSNNYTNAVNKTNSKHFKQMRRNLRFTRAKRINIENIKMFGNKRKRRSKGNFDIQFNVNHMP